MGLVVCCCPASERNGRKVKRLKQKKKSQHPSGVVGSLPLTPAAFHPPDKTLQETLSVPFVLLVYFSKSAAEGKVLINFLFIKRCEKILVSPGTELNSGCTRVCIFNGAALQVTKIVPHSATLIIWVITTNSHS